MTEPVSERAAPNDDLAALLDRWGRGDEPEPVEVLTALFAGGAFVPVTAAGKVMFLPDDEQPPTLLAFTGAEVGADLLPSAAAMVHCDAARLRDILQRTGVGVLGIRSADGQGVFSARTLEEWAAYGPGAAMRLSRSTDPLALALRDALARRIREFPAVRSAWVSMVRWEATGEEHLMLHVAVDEDLPSASADLLVRTLLGEEVERGPQHPRIGMLPLHTARHADTVAELDRLGLDTVRHDPATGRVQVLSRAHDTPPDRG